jgi:hypothetical protein
MSKKTKKASPKKATKAKPSPKSKAPSKKSAEPSISINDPAFAELPEAKANAASWPTGEKPKAAAKESKLALVIKLLSRDEGATIEDVAEATGWQKHTVRSCISHALAKKRGYPIVSEKPQGGKRIYKITAAKAGDA